MDMEFEKLAVTVEQIDEYGLITRPTKRTDSRARGFEGESVEVDAIEPHDHRRLVLDAIVGLIDSRGMGRHQRVEEAERESLDNFVAAWSGRS